MEISRNSVLFLIILVAKLEGTPKPKKYRHAIGLAAHGDIDDIIEIDPVLYVQHYHALKRIVQDHPDKPDDLEDVCGEWLYGDAGVGKSYTAREENPDYYDKPANKWWDGYQGEDCVLIDDLDMVHAVLAHHLKRWADRYSFPAEMKGTTVQIRPKKIVVTSNYTIEQIFGNCGEACVKALKRRFRVRRILDWRLYMPEPKLLTEKVIIDESGSDSFID